MHDFNKLNQQNGPASDFLPDFTASLVSASLFPLWLFAGADLHIDLLESGFLFQRATQQDFGLAFPIATVSSSPVIKTIKK